MDDDLKEMTREGLVAEVMKLRRAIRANRDSSRRDLCWFHPDLWNVLPEKYDADIEVPAWPAFMEGCVRYRKSLDEQNPNAPGTNDIFGE